MPTWEIFDQRSVPIVTVPIVAIQKRGILSLNQAAFEALSSPPAVELLFDRESRMVGLRGVDTAAPHAYTVRKQPGANTYVVSAKSFVKAYDIPTDVTRRYRADFADGVLSIDLRKAGLEIQSRRRKQT